MHLKKRVKLNFNYALDCYTKGSNFIVEVIQISLPWEPVLETISSASKEEGNEAFLQLKKKYS